MAVRIELFKPNRTVALKRHKSQKSELCQGLNSHYFHIIGDDHQPNSRDLYTHYKDSYYATSINFKEEVLSDDEKWYCEKCKAAACFHSE